MLRTDQSFVSQWSEMSFKERLNDKKMIVQAVQDVVGVANTFFETLSRARERRTFDVVC